MAGRIRTVEFLPEIFRTETNRQFLNATLDQLVQDPKLKPTQGYIGRRVGPGVNPNDNYVLEPTRERTNYQLEPGVINLAPNTNTVTEALTYPGMLDALSVKGGTTVRQDRLWQSEYYSWDPFVDFDKFINFSQYYWLPSGPDSVDVFAAAVPLRDDFTITRGTDGYTFSGVPGTNPSLTLVRQGNYNFDVQQTGNGFWIQAVPGTSGVLPQTPNQSSREVLGVINNGDDNGTITFDVPNKAEQNFYYQLTDAGAVDFATDIQFDDINNIYLSEFIERYGGIDGITDLDGRTLIFLTDAGWFYTGLFDSPAQAFDTVPFDETLEITLDSQKFSVWRITLIYDDPLNPYIRLSVDRPINNLSRVRIEYGTQYSNISFYKNASGQFERIPLITANLDYLYYQDANNPEFFGIIKLVDQAGDQTLDINDIIGKKQYTSPNGVVFTNGLKVQFQGLTEPASYEGQEYYVEGVGTAIQLLPVGNFITPETYTRSSTVPFDSLPYDVGGYDDTLNAPLDPDYLTMNRASRDQNAWARSNRWFHIDVINATAEYNGVDPVINNDFRAKRPVLEFRPDIKLINMGTEAIPPINVIDFSATDAFSDINGTIGYSVDGYSFIDGSRIIFAADRDLSVRNKVYVVRFITPTGSGTPVIDLQPADITSPGALINQNTVCLSGITLQGKSFYFDGVDWLEAQHKTDINQPILFDVFDENGASYSDRLVYPGTSFVGSKLFSYALGPGGADSIIGQPLKYLTINNVGDIVFENNLYTDTFVYTQDTISVELSIENGVVRQYLDRVAYQQLLGWQTANTTTVSRQSFSFDYTSGETLILDIPVDTTSTDIPVKVFANSIFIDTDSYTYTVNSNGTTSLVFIDEPANGTIIEVSVISKYPSQVGYYTVPGNLENNALNAGVTELTLGTIRNHYGTICQNIQAFAGEINGQNNSRDLGNLIPYGDIILQQGSPLTLYGTFINNPRFDFCRACDFNAREYDKYKNLILDNVVRNDWSNMTAAQILDECIESINIGRSDISPFYWTDTLPCGSTYQSTTYTVTPITTDTFDTLYTYDFTSANYKGILVYLNDVLLIRDLEYIVATDGPRVTITTNLEIGDVVEIREYDNTSGNFVPSTPTKLGLYPKYIPEIYLDETYVTAKLVIRGHDGSITVAFEDIRDEVLLEFEKRIYDNLKLDGNPVPLSASDVIPGQFRTTDYTQSEVTEILGVSFLAWVGANKLAYREQDYIASNEFTWNYSASQNKLDRSTLLGAWRGIYNYLYDTDSPNTRPWEMLGFSEKPVWWEAEYGPAPYTSGNLVLWDDLEAGRVMDPAGSYVIEKYKRPGLTGVIPSGTEGELLSPFEVVVGIYDQNSFRKSWTVGDDGPVEASWQKSSTYPFAIMRLLALTRPAEFFALFADRDLYRYNEQFGQYLYNNRTRLQPQKIQVYGNGVIKHSYINWIVDYNRTTGLDSTVELTTELANLDVRLCYRLASFSDKSYLKIFTEKSSPNSLNSSLLLPDESFQLSLYRNPTIDTLTWSSVIVQKTGLGYTVFGYSTTQPYFEILTSVANGNYRTITVNDTSVRVANDYNDNVTRVPYGYEFTSISGVCDFLVSYGRLKERQGMVFQDVENNRVLNWNQMCEEFLYWSQQGWAVGSLINLNPAANVLQIEKPGLVAEPLSPNAPEDILLNQNKQGLQGQDYIVERNANLLTLRGLNNNTFSYVNSKFTAYEHIIVFDNTSIFNDLIYNPATGARQSRLLFVGYTTYDWNGTLDAQGFILNQDNVPTWNPNQSYTKGQIVKYKDSYWSATKIIPPTEKFDFSVWIKSDYQRIQKGLLPNLATKADQLRNYYDVNTANLERDADLLGFGLIGFQPRRYMQNLNLDDISQVNLYSQFLGIKGTTQAAEIFTLANLGKEVAEYEIFENWAINRATYGANANRSYFEIRLNEALLGGNPCTVQVINPGQSSTADQTVLFSNLWKESYKITSPDILPTTLLNATDVQLPSAGYVNWNDADVKVFDFNELTSIISDVENIQVGTSFWVAKDNAYDWNIYRSNLVIYTIDQVKDNLNGRSTVTFAGQHGLTVNQYIIIKYFDPEVDGAYRVVSVPSLRTITIEKSLAGDVTTLEGTGVCFVLESMRVRQASDVALLTYANSLLPGNQAWVDDDGTGHWAVYEKINPFGNAKEVKPANPLFNSRFGSAISQGYGNLGALVGAPGLEEYIEYTGNGVEQTFSFAVLPTANAGSLTVRLNGSDQIFGVDYTVDSDAKTVTFSVAPADQDDVVILFSGGGVYAFTKADTETYVESTLMTMGANNFEGYGSSLATGNSAWGVAGAPLSWAKQGYAVAIRRDLNTGAYLQTQIFSEAPYRLYQATGDGSTAVFNVGSTLGTSLDPAKMGIVIDDVIQIYGTDWTYSTPSVTFLSAPDADAGINIFLYDEVGHSVAISDDERWMYLGAPSGNRVYAYNRVDVQTQRKDFTGDGDTTEFYIADVIEVDDDSGDGGIGSQQIGVTVNNIPKDANVDWTYANGAVIFNTAPNIGDVIRVTRLQSVLFFPTTPETVFVIEDLYTVTDILSFSVYVNSVLQRPNMDYTFDAGTKTVTLATGQVGTISITSATYWKKIGHVDVSGIVDDAQFGYSLATTTDGRQFIVGAQGDTVDSKSGAGRVYTFDRSVERFTVTDASVTEYTTLQPANGPVTVKVNATFLIPDAFNNDGQFTYSTNGLGQAVVEISSDLNIGDIIEIETNNFSLMQTLESQSPQVDANFGRVVDQCPTNCSLYIGVPNDSSVLPEAGSADRWVNQNRLYGLITSTNQSPTLTPSDDSSIGTIQSLRINNVSVQVSDPGSWTSVISWSSGVYVIDGTDIYRSLKAVPVGIAITNTEYWAESSWVELFANDINQTNIPNVTATSSNGYLTISIANSDAAIPFTQLLIAPGLGTVWDDLGFEPMAHVQTIEAPNQIAYSHFGASLSVSSDSLTLAIGAPQGTAAKPTTFDGGTTFFDSGATNYFDLLYESGVVYTYDLLNAANGSISNPSRFVFGQQIYDDNIQALDRFGTAVNYWNGILLVGSPRDDLGDSVGDYGRVSQLNNTSRQSAWSIRYRQQPIVDVDLLNSVFTYDVVGSNVTQYFDFIDPLQGKILGAARQNIDYLGAIDPAAYNIGEVNNYGQAWTEEHVGEIWWDLSTTRYIDYHQDTIQYAARRWSQLFPGSTVDVYQWVESSVPPAQYTGEGTVYNTTSYAIASKLNTDGLFSTRYFYWVKGLRSIPSDTTKTLSVQAISQYIENPRSSGIPYMAAISPSTVALYNARNLISAQDTILHVEFDKIANTDNVHVEYDLIASGNPESFLSGGLYRKMLDSFCGEDTLGNKVPDPNLSPADLYGVQFRPRQSFFVDRYLALQNYLERANSILAQFSISDSRRFDLLNSEEPKPTSASGEWNKQVADYAELTYQDLNEVPVGYKYLVDTDANNDGLWTIYTVILSLDGTTKELLLSRVQNYDTKLYWSYIDWVQPGFNSSIKPVAEVSTFTDLSRLTVPEGATVKVSRNSFGKYEIYQYLGGEWIRVVLEDGTIEISSELWDYAEGRFGFDVEVFDAQRFDQAPAIETRQIIKAINEELFIDNLAIYRNELLLLVFDFILTEQIAPDWLFKTSLIDVNHKIRDLLPYQIFRTDNQDFVLDYIKEVKPYHVKIKEFNLRYEGIDSYPGNVTDFDCPAYYDTGLQLFEAPALDDSDPPKYSNSEPSTDPLWQEIPWQQWYENYTLTFQSVDVLEGGSGYTVPPQVEVTGTATREAVLAARINTAGQVVAINIVDPGAGYITTPVITLTGGNGTGAVVVPVMGNDLVRSFNTSIKYDRYEYNSQVVDWEPNTKYVEGTLVRYNDKTYSVNEVDDSTELDSGSEFDPADYTVVPAGDLSAADRVIGYYTPDANEPGRELALVINGIDYPGVQVQGPDFNQNTGFDVGNFDINPFDNIDYGPEGLPTYDPAILDAIYESSFTDPYLGLRSTDINVDGGAFIDTYESHAPEELIPGSTFDTLDFRVYTRPGSDWSGDGHGFNIKSINLLYSSTDTSIDFSEIMAHAVAVRVINATNRVSLIPEIDYTVDWPNRTVTIIDGSTVGDIIDLQVYGIGGGSQLFKESYPGNLVGSSLVVPVAYSEVYELVVIVNGELVTNYTYASSSAGRATQITFNDTYTASDWVVITVLGTSTPQKSWSYPLTEYFVYDGSTEIFTLGNSLQGTNTVDLIVERNGQRLRPAESVIYVGDGVTTGPYYLPVRGEVPQGLISDNDVEIYVDGQREFLSVNFVVSPWDGSSDRYVTFNTAPPAGSEIKIALTTNAEYTIINGNQLSLRVGAAMDAVIAVTTWNDTQEQGLITQVFQGPTSTGTLIGQPFDSVDFDTGDVTGDPGSFDYSTGTVIQTNVLDTGRVILNSERLWVTLNGWRLFAGEDYTVDGTSVIIGGSILGPGDVVAITSFTQTVVPEAIAFRIFQDMLGIQRMYRIVPDNSTVLTQPLETTDDVIYVRDASHLSQPNPEANIFGVIMINGERITYRTRNLGTNTLTGLRRGVAGTAIADHDAGSDVTDIGRGEALPQRYQQNIYKELFTGDGATKSFTCQTLTVDSDDSIIISEAVRVRVGGGFDQPQSAYDVISGDPVSIEFVTAPAEGVEIEIYVIKAQVMYAQGVGTASDGQPLQEQNTLAAWFIEGRV